MRVWILYTPCQCIRHLTKRWIEIDSKTTMTKRWLPNNSESEAKKPFLFLGPKPGSVFGDSLTNDVDDVIGFLSREENRGENRINSLTLMHDVLFFISFCVAPCRFVFFSHRFQSAFFWLQSSTINIYDLFVCCEFDWHESLSHLFQRPTTALPYWYTLPLSYSTSI